jgi:hypothetical protein
MLVGFCRSFLLAAPRFAPSALFFWLLCLRVVLPISFCFAAFLFELVLSPFSDHLGSLSLLGFFFFDFRVACL